MEKLKELENEAEIIRQKNIIAAYKNPDHDGINVVEALSSDEIRKERVGR